MAERTIAAIATARGTAGIAVIRVSGADAVKICDRIFIGRNSLADAATHTVHYGHIVGADGEKIDEVLATVMLAPRTFTGEDTVEISTHGGTVAPRRVLEALFANGALPAAPGEFTKRAFLNGRIDLSRAEAVIDIISAQNELAQKNALAQSEGQLSQRIDRIRAGLLHAAAAMQVAIDYPDEELEDMSAEQILAAIDTAAGGIDRLTGLAASRGKIIRDGIKTAIIGRPNVGKSSLLNCLALEERAIVTDVAGTTRDTIEESVELGGIMLRLCDTAGIRDTGDKIEQLGVERSLRSMESADLVLLVLDAQTGLMPEDRDLLDKTAGMRRIILINKTDAAAPFPLDDAIAVSAKDGSGTDLLCARVRELFSLDTDTVEPIITNERHISALLRAREALFRARRAIAGGLEQDFAALDINEAIAALGEIDGRTVSEDIVSEVFKNFCVGK